AQARSEYDLSVGGFLRRNAVVFAVAASGVVLSAALRASGPAAPSVVFLVLWSLSPLVAWTLSRPPSPQSHELSREDTLFLRATARRTWRFFETFAGASENHLPPDNFQEDPHPVVAHRTSPTNIGLSLLATV